MKGLWRAAGAFFRRLVARRAPPQRGRFTLRQKSSLHGFLGVAAAPPWREYLIYLPRGMERLKRPPLVVWIHGCRQDPEDFAAGMADTLPSHEEVMAEGERAAGYFGGLLRRLVAHPDLLTHGRGNVAA